MNGNTGVKFRKKSEYMLVCNVCDALIDESSYVEGAMCPICEAGKLIRVPNSQPPLPKP